MNPEQAVSLEKPPVVDYCEVESKTLLNEGAKTHEALNYACAVLMLRVSLLVKEVTTTGVSESAKHIEAEARETLRE
jgi:hypothetical protein